MSKARAHLQKVLLASLSAAVMGQSSPALADDASAAAALTSRVADLESKLAYLSDRQQIHDVYLHFVWGFDRRDEQVLKSAFWPQAQINYGTVSTGVEEFMAQHFAAHHKLA